ncbi:hypothetical protein HELRODRAFT_80119, partial [Helobdella robusta]|uniref:Collagenase NC10/endostatin domain-containing protein n=1 Tax=Helobdella robusta TaxID=6412 RepID=T1G3Y1_HELRO
IHLIAANHPLSGDMDGISGADSICYKESKKFGWPNTFKAFLSSRWQDLRGLIKQGKNDYVTVLNGKNETLFDSLEDIFNGSEGKLVHKNFIYSFDGRDVLNDVVWPYKYVWHGSDKYGYQKPENETCKYWSSSDPDKYAMVGNLSRKRILSADKLSCWQRFALLCLEISQNNGVLLGKK